MFCCPFVLIMFACKMKCDDVVSTMFACMVHCDEFRTCCIHVACIWSCDACFDVHMYWSCFHVRWVVMYVLISIDHVCMYNELGTYHVCMYDKLWWMWIPFVPIIVACMMIVMIDNSTGDMWLMAFSILYEWSFGEFWYLVFFMSWNKESFVSFSQLFLSGLLLMWREFTFFSTQIEYSTPSWNPLLNVLNGQQGLQLTYCWLVKWVTE